MLLTWEMGKFIKEVYISRNKRKKQGTEKEKMVIKWIRDLPWFTKRSERRKYSLN